MLGFAAVALEVDFPVGIINWGFWYTTVLERDVEIQVANQVRGITDAEGCACFERAIAEIHAGRHRQIIAFRASAHVQNLMYAHNKAVREAPARVPQATDSIIKSIWEEGDVVEG